MFTVIQLYILAAAIVISFGTGVLVEHKFSVAGQVDALYEGIAATQKAQQDAEVTAGQTATSLSDLSDEIEPYREALYDEKNLHPSNCVLSDTTFQLLSKTAAAANSAAGKHSR